MAESEENIRKREREEMEAKIEARATALAGRTLFTPTQDSVAREINDKARKIMPVYNNLELQTSSTPPPRIEVVVSNRSPLGRSQ